MAGARGRIADFWDELTAAWLRGEDPLPDPLPDWYASYEGRGDGQVTREAFAEPYVGDLRGTPRMVTLGLNPGQAAKRKLLSSPICRAFCLEDGREKLAGDVLGCAPAALRSICVTQTALGLNVPPPRSCAGARASPILPGGNALTAAPGAIPSRPTKASSTFSAVQQTRQIRARAAVH
jgi:hypothetical protein